MSHIDARSEGLDSNLSSADLQNGKRISAWHTAQQHPCNEDRGGVESGESAVDGSAFGDLVIDVQSVVRGNECAIVQ